MQVQKCQSLLVSVSCATSYEDSSTRKAIIHLRAIMWCFRAPLLMRQCQPSRWLLPSQPLHGLAKVEEATLHPDVGNVALNGRDQGCFKIANKFRRIKLEAQFFRFVMEHIKYPAIREEISPNRHTNIRPWLVWSFATSLETSVGRLPNRLDVRGGSVGEDARKWLLEVAIGLFTRHNEHLFAASLIQLPCICHGSVDDPIENATVPFSAIVFDAKRKFPANPRGSCKVALRPYISQARRRGRQGRH
ncbi:hypothetical protein T02_6305 [Trichinella nativa]|uniref:Uncharacterized protein n=1 Tax=Trichinella nativa TaxID=6335 RepID=A0A0V1KUQ7_9BILA|nr:hypothetical protein T02_6305 [Trichinella nativa]